MNHHKKILLHLKKTLFYLAILFFFVFGGSFFIYSENNFQISKKAKLIEGALSPHKDTYGGTVGIFTGKACPNAPSRPFAVMLSGDAEARPLSGIADADMVIEIPVIVNDITRYAAFYQCGQPKEIGSIRSARTPFIGLAKGYNAVLVHWGGEKDALEKLQNNIMDNVDAIINPFNAFWRKKGVPMPHDGFTSYENLFLAAKKLNYDFQSPLHTFFTFRKQGILNNSNEIITIGYPGKFSVSYHYVPKLNTYLRFKGGAPEQDYLTKKQIDVKNVLVAWANVYHTYSQYDNVEINGKEGRLRAFIGGNDIQGIWRKEASDKPLLFFDLKGKPIELEPGNIWVEVVGLEQKVDVMKL